MRGDGHPLVDQRVVAQFAGRRLGRQVPAVDLVAYGVVPLVEVDQFPPVGELDGGPLHHAHSRSAAPTSVMISSSTLRPSSARASSGSPESVTTTCASLRPAMVAIPIMSHFVWSASTTSRRAAATSARLVSASDRLGVEYPALALIPCTPRNSRSRLIRAAASCATGPTRASDGVRVPPVSTTVWSERPRW